MAEHHIENDQELREGKRIVAIATDASEYAENAIQFYITDVRRDNDFVVLIHCPEMYDLTRATPAVVEKLVKETNEKMQKMQDKYKVILDNAGVAGKFRSEAGKPGETICRVAKEEGAVLIVTGTRGLGKIRRTFLGSVSDYLVHHSHAPVLVCRQKE